MYCNIYIYIYICINIYIHMCIYIPSIYIYICIYSCIFRAPLSGAPNSVLGPWVSMSPGPIHGPGARGLDGINIYLLIPNISY